MKHKKALCLLTPLFAFSILAAGCSWNKVSVTSIELTASYATEDAYTVNFSDGTSSTITVKHGKDVTVQDLYDRYKEEYDDELTYDEFLQKYLSYSDKSRFAVGNALLSSFRIQAKLSGTTQSGSAVLYAVNESKDEAYLVTNYHVTYFTGSYSGGSIASTIACSLYGSEQTAFSCEYIGGAASADIAVVKTKLSTLKQANPDVKPVTIAKDYTTGDTVYAIGNAEGEGISVTKGVVNVESEEVNMSVDSKTRKHRVMRIDAAIYHGNSGGGLFNANGELIGITNGGNEDKENINHAIPLPVVKGIADNVLHYYADGDNATSGAYKIMFGFSVASENARYVYDDVTGTGHIKEDVKIDSVETNSIAKTLGIKKYDLITGIEVNGTAYSIYRAYNIYDVLLTVRAGDKIKLAYTRGNAAETSDEYTVKASDLQEIE